MPRCVSSEKTVFTCRKCCRWGGVVSNGGIWSGVDGSTEAVGPHVHRHSMHSIRPRAYIQTHRNDNQSTVPYVHLFTLLSESRIVETSSSLRTRG